MSISVLITIYDKEKPRYFQKALTSIWDDQVLKPDEIVLVEDGPLTEDLYQIVGQWKEKLKDRLNVLSLEENSGLNIALNTGIDYCNHEFIARMDSDDISHPNRFLVQTKYLRDHPDIFVVGGDILEINGNDEVIAKRIFPKSPEQIKEYILKICPFSHPTVMIRNELFQTHGLRYSEKFRLSQDLDLWYQVIFAGYKMANMDEVVLSFRRDSDFYKRRSFSKAKNEFLIYWSGIRKLHGFSWKLIYPVLRIMTRMMPYYITKYFYAERFRRFVNSTHES